MQWWWRFNHLTDWAHEKITVLFLSREVYNLVPHPGWDHFDMTCCNGANLCLEAQLLSTVPWDKTGPVKNGANEVKYRKKFMTCIVPVNWCTQYNLTAESQTWPLAAIMYYKIHYYVHKSLSRATYIQSK